MKAVRKALLLMIRKVARRVGERNSIAVIKVNWASMLEIEQIRSVWYER